MGWISIGDDNFEPDGKPFESPRDSFERAYNDALARGIEEPDPEELPLSTTIADPKPTAEANCRNALDWFFEPYTQEKALEAGNTHEELDHLAKGFLTWGAYYGVPITDAERNVANRLGVNVEHLGRKVVTRATAHKLGF